MYVPVKGPVHSSTTGGGFMRGGLVTSELAGPKLMAAEGAGKTRLLRSAAMSLKEMGSESSNTLDRFQAISEGVGGTAAAGEGGGKDEGRRRGA